MTTHRGLDMIGLGSTSISQLIGTGFWQKEKDIEVYEKAIQEGRIPMIRGIHFSQDDRIRQEILSDLYCYGGVNLTEIGEKYAIDIRSTFARELENLHVLAEEGLVEFVTETDFTVTLPLGRVLLRNVGAIFDAYLDPDAWKIGDRYYYSVSA
jgi:oxygen-independent coproporphyrinogen-3 oxidase